jgi:uncharacterized DUF497 family protein
MMFAARFEWDPAKAEQNWREHHIRFEEAATVFDDPHLWSEPDNRFEYSEQRRHIIGMSGRCLLLVVAHTFRGDDDSLVVRIISAREAQPHERRLYGNRKR